MEPEIIAKPCGCTLAQIGEIWLDALEAKEVSNEGNVGW